MMNLEFFFRALGEIWVAGEILLAALTTRWRGQDKTQDRGSQILLWIVIVASSWIDAWLHSFLSPDMPGSSTWLRPAAFAILVLGLAIRVVAIFTLGRAFSANVALRENQKLKRNGLYALVRHPSYLGLELILLGFSLHSRTWACFAVFLIPPTLALLYRIHVEENMLRRAFGADYEDYRRSTKRLVPGIY